MTVQELEPSKHPLEGHTLRKFSISRLIRGVQELLPLSNQVIG